MRRVLTYTFLIILLSTVGYFVFLYNAIYSTGIRSGELIRFSHKGVVFKTYEGELSQGISGAQIFSFSVLDNQEKVISDMKKFEGHYVKVTYIERYKTFPWWGDNKFFIIDVKKEISPFKIK